MSLSSEPIRTSVLIASYNSRGDLERCLPGLMASIPADTEIIVVDNASSDGSAEYVRSNYPEILTIRSSANLGYGGANNLAAGVAHGQLLVFLNPDTIVRPGWLQGLVAALETNPKVGVATPAIFLLDDPDVINACGNEVHTSGLTLCRGMGQRRGAFPWSERVAAVSGAAFIIPKVLFLEMGGFDERFFLYMEDTDLSLRVRLAGYEALYTPDSVVYHDYRLDFSPLKVYYQERNRYRMLIKCLRWRTLLALLPVLCMAEAVTWGFVLVNDRGNWRNKLHAYGTVIRDWEEIRQARGEVQHRRCISDEALLRMTSPYLDFKQAGDGWPVTAADRFFNPIFTALHGWVLAIARGG